MPALPAPRPLPPAFLPPLLPRRPPRRRGKASENVTMAILVLPRMLSHLLEHLLVRMGDLHLLLCFTCTSLSLWQAVLRCLSTEVVQTVGTVQEWSSAGAHFCQGNRTHRGLDATMLPDSDAVLGYLASAAVLPSERGFPLL